MASKQQMSGMRGVFLGAAELARRGFIVAPAMRTTAGVDLLITDDLRRNAYSVQVTTNRGSNYWIFPNAEVVASDSHLYLFVDIRGKRNTVKYFIVPSEKVSEHHYAVRQPTGAIWCGISRKAVKKHRINLKPGRQVKGSK